MSSFAILLLSESGKSFLSYFSQVLIYPKFHSETVSEPVKFYLKLSMKMTKLVSFAQMILSCDMYLESCHSYRHFHQITVGFHWI